MGGRTRALARLTAAALAWVLAGCASAGAGTVVTTSQDADLTTAAALPATTAAAQVAGDATEAADADRSTTARSTDAASARLAMPWREGQGLSGFDVSRYQENVDWEGLVASGDDFVYVKATEGSDHRSPTHDDQRAAARAVGLLQGAYHYARPAQSSGTLQARFFQGNGGAWSPDGSTLPGALDLEFAESGDACHGLDATAMVAWIREFSDEYLRLSGRVPVIYTTSAFWAQCTGGDTSFGDHPLWLYDHADVPGTLPAGWTRPTLWQRGVVADLDRNVFFGTPDQLVTWASSPLG